MTPLRTISGVDQIQISAACSCLNWLPLPRLGGRAMGRIKQSLHISFLDFPESGLWEDDWAKFWAAIFHSAYKVTISSHTQENNMKTRWDKIRRKKTRAPKRSWKRQCCIHCVESQNPSDPKSRKVSVDMRAFLRSSFPWAVSSIHFSTKQRRDS